MRFAKIIKCDISAGTGCRVSLYCQGCSIHCKGCHNPELWDFNKGNEFTIQEINEILNLLDKPFITGLSILGGEPMEEENQKALLPLVKAVKEKLPEKSIWLYTGYEFIDIRSGGKKYIPEITTDLLSNIDVAVVGPFVLEKRDISTAHLWRGSTNQRVLDLKKSLEADKPIPLKEIPNNEI